MGLDGQLEPVHVAFVCVSMKLWPPACNMNGVPVPPVNVPGALVSVVFLKNPGIAPPLATEMAIVLPPSWVMRQLVGELTAGMVVLTKKAFWNNNGLYTTCSLAPGSATEKPNCVLPLVHAVDPAQQIVLE